ncbi:Flp family type IVb pilin [Qipengyuania sediminis]|uniref:Flp family type IVb pilin n=1 Tax=Qipengyuania sediminis TaxID=1532023 RepID=UPI00105A3E9F|nr:Flp family type IVb pilin [Qipengyuania sediminis]
MIKFLARLSRDAKGATAVEYGLILALVFLAMLGGITAFGQAAIEVWMRISNAYTSVS